MFDEVLHLHLHLFGLKKQDAYITVWHTTVEPDTQGTLVHWQWPTHKYNGKDYRLSKSYYELIKMIKHN